MADIFISYASDDRGRAEILAIKLQEQGWSVWWDRDLPFGRPFDEVIRAEVHAAKCVVAIWTESSVDSLYVIGEARDALRQNKLISFFLSQVQAKLPYDLQAIQGLELIGWKGDSADADFQRLVRGIDSLVGPHTQNKDKVVRELDDEEKVRKGSEDDDIQKGKERHVENGSKDEDARLLVQENRNEQLTKSEAIESPSIESLKAKHKKGIVIGAVLLVVVLSFVGWFLASNKKSSTKPESIPVIADTPLSRKSSITIPDPYTNSIGMKFVYIDSGTFTMGSPKNEPERKMDEREHQVILTQGFYMQTTEVTQRQWRAVMHSNPSRFTDCGPDCPVEKVSWDDTMAFINKLNQMDKKATCRLPTEAEWEYAARAGTKTPFAFGDCLSTDQANYNGTEPYDGCPKGRIRKTTMNVGSFKPNTWDLFDMHGNVWEWCQDWYGDYQEGVDPKGLPSGTLRVVRGGGWAFPAGMCRAASRHGIKPGDRDNKLGFRLVLLPSQ